MGLEHPKKTSCAHLVWTQIILSMSHITVPWGWVTQQFGRERKPTNHKLQYYCVVMQGGRRGIANNAQLLITPLIRMKPLWCITICIEAILTCSITIEPTQICGRHSVGTISAPTDSGGVWWRYGEIRGLWHDPYSTAVLLLGSTALIGLLDGCCTVYSVHGIYATIAIVTRTRKIPVVVVVVVEAVPVSLSSLFSCLI